MAGLDSVLNFVVPIAVFILMGFIFWRAFSGEITSFIDWIKGNMGNSGGNEMYSPGKKNLYGWETGGIDYRK